MWTLCGKTYSSRLITWSSLFTSPEVMSEAIAASGAELITVALRHAAMKHHDVTATQRLLEELGLDLLPATIGCHLAKDAVTTAYQARDLLGTHVIKLEVVGDDATNAPDTAAVIDAAAKLLKQGFEVLPVTNDDIVAARRLVESGCTTLLVRGSAGGNHGGLTNVLAMRGLRARLPDTALIIDGGITRPSEAALAMELGFDGVIVDEAIALARDPITMAEAFADAVVAGRMGFEAGLKEARDASNADHPLLGTPVWHTMT
jgi:thiazole synthase